MKKRVQTENGGEQRKDISDTGAWIGKVGTRERASDLEGARAKGSPVSARGLGSRSLRFRSTARADPFCN